MTEISPENGTPIDALETGQVQTSADAARMAEILRDMNASGADVGGGSVGGSHNEYTQPPPSQLPPHTGVPMGGMNGPLPPMIQQHVQQHVQQQKPHPNFVPYEETVGPRRNVWGTFLERLMDPLVVAVLVFVLSLPALQTLSSKWVPWAFAIGGELSWLGLFCKALVAGGLFAFYKSVSSLF